MKTKTDNRESYKEFRSNEPSGEGKNIGKNGSRSGNGRTGKINDAWDKPVSKRYYGKLKEKVSRIVQALGYVRGYTDELMKCIDRYLATKEIPRRNNGKKRCTFGLIRALDLFNLHSCKIA